MDLEINCQVVDCLPRKHHLPQQLCPAFGSSLALLIFDSAREDVRRNLHYEQIASFLCLLSDMTVKMREYFSSRTGLYCYLTCNKHQENSTGKRWKLNLSSSAPVRESNVWVNLSVWFVMKKKVLPCLLSLQPSLPPPVPRGNIVLTVSPRQPFRCLLDLLDYYIPKPVFPRWLDDESQSAMRCRCCANILAVWLSVTVC